MAIKFHLPDGSETDIVAHSFNGFPVATADEFREMLIALSSSGPGGKKPAPLDEFLSSHPRAKTFLETQIPPPVSYATVSYFGVNTFKFTNSKGAITFGRYQIRPGAEEEFLTESEVANVGANYLSEEIRERLARGLVSFQLLLQIAAEGDDLDDPSVAWPENRERIELGYVEIHRVVANSAAAERDLLFLPGALPEGIEAQDPMIKARQSAYPVSFERRNKQGQEKKAA